VGVTVIVGYKPHEGKEEELMNEVRQHVPILRGEGLATNQEPFVMRSKAGVIVEVFEWVSQEAIAKAHENVIVAAMWERYSSCCDYVPVRDLPEFQDFFAGFEAVHLD
jgi:quinol monooxygenase YgiN